MLSIPIRYSIPLLIVLFTGILAAYTVQRDWDSAEAVVRGEAVAHMIKRMTEMQAFYGHALSSAGNARAGQHSAFMNDAAELQFAALTDDSERVVNATKREWVGQLLEKTAESDWGGWLNEPLQSIIERVRKQHGGEVTLMGKGRYVLGVYPVALGGLNAQDEGRIGILVAQRDLTRDLMRARRTVGEHTTEMVSLLIILAVCIGFLVHFFFTRRLNQLVSATDKFAGGNFSVRANLRGKDEVAKLGSAFNRMAVQVADVHKALELRVKDRTTELANTVTELQKEIDERNRIEHALFNQKERIEVTLASIGDAVITTDTRGRIDYLNPVAEKLAGKPKSSVIGRSFPEIFNLFDEFNCQPAPDPVRWCLEERGTIELGNNILLNGRDEQERCLDISAAPIHDRDFTIIGVVLICRDVTEVRQMTRQLSYQASHDSMTGLINRREFERRLKQALETVKFDESHALLYLDLDYFKIVNDTCGHMAGDELLRQISALLIQEIRKRDTLARLGGDEFGVLLEDCQTEQALQIANKIRATIENFCFPWENRSFRVGVSIGVVPIKPSVDTLSSILRTADIACYAAKELGGNRVHVYQTDDIELAQRHGELQWIPRIQEALEKNMFALFFQPIFPLGRENDMHYEVLLRMIDHDGDLMLPSMFIPVAERYNQMQAIDRWVVQHAFAALNDPQVIPQHVNLAINLSGQSLSDPKFLAFVERQIETKSVQIERVCFEVTETAAIGNLFHAQRFFSALKPRGCKFALDDFGSGLSSFAYLKTLPIDFLKIDGAFVKDMANDPIDYAMVEAIHRIGHVMGIETIAEFVESDVILTLLKNIGVNYAQGNCLANPKPLVAGGVTV